MLTPCPTCHRRGTVPSRLNWGASGHQELCQTCGGTGLCPGTPPPLPQIVEPLETRRFPCPKCGDWTRAGYDGLCLLCWCGEDEGR